MPDKVIEATAERVKKPTKKKATEWDVSGVRSFIDRQDIRPGLYRKFNIERTDGSSRPGEKHADCRYFVLDLNHDQHSISALVAYAKSIRKMKDLEHFELALECVYLAKELAESRGLKFTVPVGFRAPRGEEYSR